jgi:hypothetical protein
MKNNSASIPNIGSRVPGATSDIYSLTVELYYDDSSKEEFIYRTDDPGSSKEEWRAGCIKDTFQRRKGVPRLQWVKVVCETASGIRSTRSIPKLRTDFGWIDCFIE